MSLSFDALFVRVTARGDKWLILWIFVDLVKGNVRHSVPPPYAQTKLAKPVPHSDSGTKSFLTTIRVSPCKLRYAAERYWRTL